MTYDELLRELRRWSDRNSFAEIVREEAKRTVLVPGPAPDTWYVIDQRAIDAG